MWQHVVLCVLSFARRALDWAQLWTSVLLLEVALLLSTFIAFNIINNIKMHKIFAVCVHHIIRIDLLR